jgi:uncharacterized SAM-binding protein YcdF (DUF218 family)
MKRKSTKRISPKIIQIFGLFRKILIVAGLFFTVLLVVALTSLPYWGYYWLGTSKSVLKWKPEVIVMLGGSGMPSESNLMRSWFASSAAGDCPECEVLIVMPGDTTDKLSTPVKMRSELIIRGVNSQKIRFESNGTNTRSQALECLRLIGKETPILIITSPEHMRRAVLSFRKAGFEKVNALPAFENAAEADFSFVDKELGGRQMLIPDVGQNTQVRYQVWNHLKYEIVIARELAALTYYRIRGWI